MRFGQFFLLTFVSSFAVNCGVLVAEESEDLVAVSFRSAYDEWKQLLRGDRDLWYRSSIPYGRLYDNAPFRRIVTLGVPAIPHISDRLAEDPFLFQALLEITKWKYHFSRNGDSPKDFTWTLEGFPEIRVNRIPNRVIVWDFWWTNGRFRTGERFAELYNDWATMKVVGRQHDADEMWQKIVDLGIPVLPHLVEIAEQSPEFVRAISILSSGGVPPTATAAECKKWWDDNKYKFELPPRKALGKVDEHE